MRSQDVRSFGSALTSFVPSRRPSSCSTAAARSAWRSTRRDPPSRWSIAVQRTNTTCGRWTTSTPRRHSNSDRQLETSSRLGLETEPPIGREIQKEVVLKQDSDALVLFDDDAGFEDVFAFRLASLESILVLFSLLRSHKCKRNDYFRCESVKTRKVETHAQIFRTLARNKARNCAGNAERYRAQGEIMTFWFRWFVPI